MKLTFIIGSLHLGGAERVITEISGGLAERGHDVTLIYSFKYRDYVVNNKVKQIDLNSFEFDIYHGSRMTRLKNKLLNIYRDYHFLRKYIKEERPDCFISFMRCWAWYLILQRKKTHVVFSEHSSMLLKSNGIGRWLKRNILLPKADAVTVLTYFDQGLINSQMKKVVCMPNPLTFVPLSLNEFNDLFPKRKNILACGRLDTVKGYDHLIKAFALIADKYPEWNLDIAGKDTPKHHYSDTLKQLVDELNLNERVKLIGFHSDVKSLMKKYSIFCVPSRSEGFSLTLIEAMASGIATISYELTGPREITLNEVDGLLVENQNIEALSIGIKRLIEDEQLRYSFSRRALSNVERFSEDIIIGRWEMLFERILKEL